VEQSDCILIAGEKEESGFAIDYPELFVQRALGQSPKIFHGACARNARGELPSSEYYETAKRREKILLIKPESEMSLATEFEDLRIAQYREAALLTKRVGFTPPQM
jgi:hypothetical protein